MLTYLVEIVLIVSFIFRLVSFLFLLFIEQIADDQNDGRHCHRVYHMLAAVQHFSGELNDNFCFCFCFYSYHVIYLYFDLN